MFRKCTFVACKTSEAQLHCLRACSRSGLIHVCAVALRAVLDVRSALKPSTWLGWGVLSLLNCMLAGRDVREEQWSRLIVKMAKCMPPCHKASSCCRRRRRRNPPPHTAFTVAQSSRAVHTLSPSFHLRPAIMRTQSNRDTHTHTHCSVGCASESGSFPIQKLGIRN